MKKLKDFVVIISILMIIIALAIGILVTVDDSVNIDNPAFILIGIILCISSAVFLLLCYKASEAHNGFQGNKRIIKKTN